MTTGEIIKYYRKANSITQKKLSELTGIHEVTIRQYEAGKYSPKYNNLKKIANVFGINPTDLIGVQQDSPIASILEQIPSATIEDGAEGKRINLLNIRELHNYFCLNKKGKAKALSYINDLAKLPEYTSDEPPTSE